MKAAATVFAAVLSAALVSSARAQDLEPRAYSNAPVGMNFLITGYTYFEGGLATDPAGPIQNAHLEVHGPIAAYARTLGIAGKSAKIDVVVPYSFLSGTADVAGEPRTRDVSGLWDPRVRFSINLYGAPALSPREFATYHQDWIVGVSLQVGMPLGQYDDTRVVNLGNNRWSFKPEFGVSKVLGHWSCEVAAAATFYTDNEDYVGNRTRQQDPVFSIQGHLVYIFPSRIWVALDGTFYEGGAATLDGAPQSDSLHNSRAGLTLALPINARNSLKLFTHTGVSVRTGTDFNAFGALWQYRWGGGIK